MIIPRPLYIRVEGGLTNNYHWSMVKEIIEDLNPQAFRGQTAVLRKDGQYLRNGKNEWYFKPYNKNEKITENPVMEF